MTRDSDPLTTPSGQPVIRRRDGLRNSGDLWFSKKPTSKVEHEPRINPERRKPKLVKPRTPRILDAYEAMQARAAGRLYDDDDISPFTSEDDE